MVAAHTTLEPPLCFISYSNHFEIIGPRAKNTLAMLEPFGLNSSAIDDLAASHNIHTIAELLEANNRDRIISALPVKHTATGEIIKLCRKLPRLRAVIEVRVLPDDDDAELQAALAMSLNQQ